MDEKEHDATVNSEHEPSEEVLDKASDTGSLEVGQPQIATGAVIDAPSTDKGNETSHELDPRGQERLEGEAPDPLSDIHLQTRKEIVTDLIQKHARFRLTYQNEMDGFEVKPPEIVNVKEGERSIRDIINDEVQSLKNRRKELREANKRLRLEFFDLLEKEDRLKDHRREVEKYSKYSRDLEWKLETEAITIETERRLLDELRDTLEKMRSITDGFTPEEIQNRLIEIQEEMGTNLMRIEELHNALLEKVEESNVHHEKYVDANKQIRERESRRGWLKRRIELHTEMETFWKTQMDQSEKLDSEEFDRSLEAIRTSLLQSFEQREKDDEEEDRSRDLKDQTKNRKGDRKDRNNRPEKGQKRQSAPDATSPSVPDPGKEALKVPEETSTGHVEGKISRGGGES